MENETDIAGNKSHMDNMWRIRINLAHHVWTSHVLCAVHESARESVRSQDDPRMLLPRPAQLPLVRPLCVVADSWATQSVRCLSAILGVGLSDAEGLGLGWTVLRSVP